MSQGPRHINTDRSLNRPTEQRPTEATTMNLYYQNKTNHDFARGSPKAG